MKKVILKFTFVVISMVVSVFGVWKAHEAYNVTASTLLIENVEALSSDNGDKTWLEKLFDGCYDSFASLQSKQCMSSQTNISTGANAGGSVGTNVNGVPVTVGASAGGNFNYSNTQYNGQSKWECESGGFGHCDRREQTDCNDNKCGSACCS